MRIASLHSSVIADFANTKACAQVVSQLVPRQMERLLLDFRLREHEQNSSSGVQSDIPRNQSSAMDGK